MVFLTSTAPLAPKSSKSLAATWPKLATLRQAAESLRVVLAEVKSAEKGKTVKL